MNAAGLTAYVITIHTPAALMAMAVGMLVATVVVIVQRKKQAAARAWFSFFCFVSSSVFVYAVLCAAFGVRGFSAEAISLLP